VPANPEYVEVWEKQSIERSLSDDQLHQEHITSEKVNSKMNDDL
jgi:hypothetical protein